MRSLSLLLAAAALVALLPACSHEVSHSESDKPNLFGGRTKTETTVTQNPDGSLSTEHSSQTTH